MIINALMGPAGVMNVKDVLTLTKQVIIALRGWLNRIHGHNPIASIRTFIPELKLELRFVFLGENRVMQYG
jgi:hypothetical protein